jgi:hypothetical protein
MNEDQKAAGWRTREIRECGTFVGEPLEEIMFENADNYSREDNINTNIK